MPKKRLTAEQLLIISLFAIIIFGLRYTWVQYFSNSSQIDVTDGEVFISGERDLESQSQLVGDWAFYPEEFLEDISEAEESERKLLKVPGGWSEAFSDESPYGYGTYHLRIHLDSNLDDSYSLRLYSIRSSSKVIANGYQVGGSGTVSNNEEAYDAFNIPYNSYSLRANEDGIIDVFVQVANHTDPRSGGIIRSVYFGNEKSIERTTYISSVLQVFSGTIFILHALFALIIYLVGIRNKEILYFSVGLLMLALLSLNAGDEKIMMQFTKMNYVFSYKFSMFILFVLALAIIHALKNTINKLHPKIVPIYSAILIIMIILSILLPMEYLVIADQLTLGSVLLSMILAVLSLTQKKLPFSSSFDIGLILASIAIINHIIWFIFALETGTKVIYYPFDLILALILLSTVWFKHYYKMNVEFKLQADRLAELDREKDLFLANTAHELNNPLHSIVNMSQAVLHREQRNLQEESQQDLEMLFTVSKRMSILVNDLLEMALLDNRKPTLFIQKTSLQGIVEGVLHMNIYLLEGKNLKIISKIPSDFPAVLADENRLTQIVYNLVHNAIKFTDQGRITIEAEVFGDKALISISDTGPGIEPSVLAELFTPYQQGEVPYEASKSEGLGLGLYIAKQLIEYMSGEINVESVLGQGSKFVFSLPIVKDDSVSKEGFAPKDKELAKQEVAVFTDQDALLERYDLKQGLSASKVEGRPKVIVVDDDPINLRVIEVVLHNEQYDVTTALSGAEVMELLAKNEYDLIISDVMMPRMSGYELVKNIRKRFTMSELPILLLTSRDRIRDVQHGFDVGANDYITKPIDASELNSRVKALTDVRSAARESLHLESAFLQAQIQPHFIFNTINSIMALSEIDIKRMQKLLEAFSDVLRSKFEFKNIKYFSLLKEELNLIEAYLYIEQVRFGDRVKVLWEIDDYTNVQIPSVIIQPIVENAVVHGITARNEGGTIKIKVIEHDKEVEVVIEDDGVGIPAEKLDRILSQKRVSDSGVGIYNTNLRLVRTYGKGLEIESEEGKGTRVSICLPK